MMWTNYHTHSKYCDGKGDFTEYLGAAKTNRVFSLGFSSHAPLPFECDWCMRQDELDNYFEEIDFLKHNQKDIEIYKGLEIDFIPDVVSPFQFKDRLDYTIGAIHFVDQFKDGKRWEIDGPHNLFLSGLKEIFKGNFKDAAVRYLDLVREMIFASAPDIIAHLDKIKIQNAEGKFFNETDPWYQQEMEKTLKLVDQANLIVEVNTRGIYQKKTTTTYPSPWILEIIKKKNIPITISSDAHHPNDLVSHFKETAKVLYDMGFRNISILKHGVWKQLPFNPDGIIS